MDFSGGRTKRHRARARRFSQASSRTRVTTANPAPGQPCGRATRPCHIHVRSICVSIPSTLVTPPPQLHDPLLGLERAERAREGPVGAEAASVVVVAVMHSLPARHCQIHALPAAHCNCNCNCNCSCNDYTTRTSSMSKYSTARLGDKQTRAGKSGMAPAASLPRQYCRSHATASVQSLAQVVDDQPAMPGPSAGYSL